MVEAKHQPNASKGIPLEPGIPDSGQSTAENDRLAFESIIAVHNTYFIVLIAALSVYFGIVGTCWKFAFGTNNETYLQRFVQVCLLVIPVLVCVAVFKGMQYALSGCTARQKYLNDLADKLDICSQDYLNGLVDNCSIDLYLLPYSAKVSMVVIGVLSVINLILLLCVLLPCVWKCVKVVKVILAPWVRHLMGK